MTRFIALLRGINVGGNTLKMDRLRDICSELGLVDVKTYVQSGNVVFKSKATPAKLSQLLEKALAHEARLPISVIVLGTVTLERVITDNPFLADKSIDRSKLHVTFLASPASETALKKLHSIDAGADQWHGQGDTICLHCPNGYGRTKLSNTTLERLLAVRATTRNWNTVNKLYEMTKA
jgi:uncharacterized protein (DUF1697 family)